MPFCSEEWVIEPSKADGHGQADEQQGRAHAQGNEVPPGKGAPGIPGALAVLAKAAQPADSSDDAEETITDAVEDPEEFVDAA